MKKIFLILITLVCSISLAHAHDIHWITFVDTTDPSVGETDVNTRQILYSRWINVVNSALAPKGYNSRIHDFTGSRTSPDNCRDVVKNLICKPEDIIVFYYIGHGARSIDDKSRYPQMALAQNGDDCVPLEMVHEELKNKHARLTLTIGMCCNTYAERLSSKEYVGFSANQGHSYVAMDAISNIQQLFLENTGDIIIASSDKGQASWGGYIPGVGLIDCFSYTLINTFNKEVNKSYAADWESILSDIQTTVNNETLAASLQPNSKVTQQTPIFDINIEDSQAPEPQIEKKPVVDRTKVSEKENSDSEDEELKNEVTKVIDGIISTELTRDQREYIANMLLEYFDNNAYVRILGQDVDVIIDKQSAKDYFDHLSFTVRQKPLKVAVVNIEYSASGKIKGLIVREVYTK